MSAYFVCSSCRRALTAQWRQGWDFERSVTKLFMPQACNGGRPLSSSALRRKPSTAPKPYQPKQLPPKEQINDAGSARQPRSSDERFAPSGPPSPSIQDTTRSIAQGLRDRMPGMTETYVAFGGCERLLKECARQADYSRPKALEKDARIPEAKDGLELGVGKGWWYESEFAPFTASNLPRAWSILTEFSIHKLSICLPPSTPGLKSLSCTCISSPYVSAAFPPAKPSTGIGI